MPKFLYDYLSRLLFVLLFVLSFKNSEAQNVTPAVVNATGGTFIQNNITYEWSVGELALVETMTSGKLSLTNGLLQSVGAAQLITDGFTILPSNILTPNGDGKNDTWVIKDIEKYPDNEITVFDRSGRVVFRTKNYQNNWNGNFSGQPLSEDTYYYMIILKKDGRTGTLKGFITILN